MRYLLFLILTACGMDVKVKYDTPPPITVNHNINFNFDQVKSYCEQSCKVDNFNEDDVNTCTNKCFLNFMELFSKGAL